jgi:hypothetical protein
MGHCVRSTCCTKNSSLSIEPILGAAVDDGVGAESLFTLQPEEPEKELARAGGLAGT